MKSCKCGVKTTSVKTRCVLCGDTLIAEGMPDLDLSAKSGFKVFEAAGQSRWMAWAASAFRDREGEIFKTKALERYVAEAYRKNDHGKLWFYHLPIPIGDADFSALFDKILIKIGTFATDTEAGRKALAYFAGEPPGWGVSVGYKYREEDRKDREYDWLWVFETSPVPTEMAAFPLSRFKLEEATKMTKLTKDQKAKLQEVFGDGWQALVEEAEEASKTLEEYGFDFKAAGDEDLAMLLDRAIARLEQVGEEVPSELQRALAALETLAEEGHDERGNSTPSGAMEGQKAGGDHPLARLAAGTPLGPRRPAPVRRAKYKADLESGTARLVEVDVGTSTKAASSQQHPLLKRLGGPLAITTEQYYDEDRKATVHGGSALERLRETAGPLGVTAEQEAAALEKYEEEEAARKALAERPSERYKFVTCPICGHSHRIAKAGLQRTSRYCPQHGDIMQPTPGPADTATARKSAARPDLGGGGGKLTSGY